MQNVSKSYVVFNTDSYSKDDTVKFPSSYLFTVVEPEPVEAVKAV
jgi:hypothetical protein